MSVKIAFNNFKPFNENCQMITKKPITLIYGPNSTGKSSLIDALLYYHNLRLASKGEYGDEEYLNISNKYFAGDKLNLGNFESIVHKKDTSRILNFETTYLNDKKKFEELIPNYKEFVEIAKTLDIYKKRETEDFSRFLTEVIVRSESKEDQSDSPIDERWYELLDKYYSLEGDIIRKEMLDEVFKHKEISLENKVLCFENYIDFLIKITSIKQLKVVNKVGKENSHIWSGIDFYIDDEILFSCRFKKIVENYKIYSHDIFQPLLFIHKQLDKEVVLDKDVHIATVNIFSSINLQVGKNSIVDFSNSVVSNIFDLKYSYNIQYIGPLRLVPSKNDLFQKVTDNKESLLSLKTRRYKREEEFSKDMLKRIKSIFFFLKKHTSLLQKISEALKKISKVEKKYLKQLKYLWKNPGLYNTLSFIVIMLSLVVYFIVILLPLVVVFVIFSMVMMLLGLTIMFTIFLAKVLFPFLFEHYMLKIKYKFSNLFSKTNTFSNVGSVTSERMWADFVRSDEIQKEINMWLGNKIMKSHYKVQVDTVEGNWLQKILGKKDKQRLSFLDMKTNTKVYPDEMGTGISQVLPILISSKMRKNSTIFIEQPELHLHPALQSELADDFIESIHNNGNEFMIETHSEHLLLRMMKRMKQTAEGTMEDEALKLTPDDICLLYVDSDEDSTYIQELRLSKKGKLLDHWPNGFFEEGFNERFS